MNLKAVFYIVVHNSIGFDDYIWKNFFTDQNTCSASSYCGKKRIVQIFGRNRKLPVAQGLQRSDLCSLFLYHSCHGSKTDQGCHKEKDHRENFSYTFDPVCIIPIIRIFRKIISVCDDPFRFFDL